MAAARADLPRSGGNQYLLRRLDASRQQRDVDGEPALEDVPGTSLQWASNSESDVFFDKVGKQWYVLLSGAGSVPPP